MTERMFGHRQIPPDERRTLGKELLEKVPHRSHFAWSPASDRPDPLDSHPKIECEDELLLNKMFFPERFLQQRASLFNHEVFGFKLLTPHFEYQNINDSDKFTLKLFDSGYKIIKFFANLRWQYPTNGVQYVPVAYLAGLSDTLKELLQCFVTS